MSSSKGSLYDQLKSLGIRKRIHSRTETPSNSRPDKRSATKDEPNVDDMTAAMARKLEASSGIKESDNVNGKRSKPRRKVEAPKFVREVRKSKATKMPSRDANANVEDGSNKPLRSKLARLTRDAQRRLGRAPSRATNDEPIASHAAKSEKLQAASRKSKAQPAETAEPTADQLFQHITQLVGASAPAIEERPTRIKADDVELLEERIDLGARWLRDHPEPDLGDGYMVGFDFGTSALKMVVREPYNVGNDVSAFAAPDQLQSQGHPYLWQTVVWFDPNSEIFSLYPTPGSLALEGFKTGIIGGEGDGKLRGDASIDRYEAATAFIALQLCNLLGWFALEKPLPRCSATNFLKVNVGVPVATMDDPVGLQPFKEVMVAAIELAKTCEPVNLESVRAALEAVRDEELPSGFGLVPELSAALVGYAQDDTSSWGSHMLIDVGASTLDVVAFNLVDNNDEAQISAFSASVELLGAAALAVARENNVLDPDFTIACNHQIYETLRYTWREDVAPMCFKPGDRSGPVQLVTTGGGCATKVHSSLLAKLPQNILGGGSVLRPEPPKSIAAVECDRSRLLVAFGLAHDDPDIPHARLPSKIPSLTPITPKPSPYIGPEQM